MDWRLISTAPLVMWSLYAVLGSLASRALGEKLTIGFEAAAMVLVACLALLGGGALSDLRRATTLHMSFAIVMGLMSALGLLVQFYAFRVAPQSGQGTVVMIGGLFPALAVVLFHGMARLGIEGGAVATPRQWLGVGTAALALWLISGGK